MKQRALECVEQARYGDAVREFQRIVDLHPDSPDAHFNLGISLIANQEREEATKEFGRSFSLDPGDLETGKQYARTLLEQENVEEGRTVLEMILLHHPTDGEVRNALAALAEPPPDPISSSANLPHAVCEAGRLRPEADSPSDTAAAGNRSPAGTDLDSRFVTVNDRKVRHLVFPLPAHWWSRPYEYAWAMQFAKPDHVVLDAACGISHPLKFHLAGQCRETHACDLDPRIVSRQGMRDEIARDYGIDAPTIPEACFTKPVYRHASLTNLPYADKTFDTIFCISVLEHLSPPDFDKSLREFARTVADNGTIVLTFDYPRIQLDAFERTVKESGLEFVGSYDRTLPAEALYSEEFRLHCFRAVLKKRSASPRTSFDYRTYWEERYKRKGTSGLGSYGKLAEFKAEVVNRIVREHGITTVVEYGCGDGNNLRYMEYRSYVGLDVAPTAVETCRAAFKDDPTKSFAVYEPAHSADPPAVGDLVVCLDVLYHIIPDEDFHATLRDVFASARHYVVLFTSIDAFEREPYLPGSHVRHRDTLALLRQFPEFEIENIVEQKYPEISSAHFVILRRKQGAAKETWSPKQGKRRIGFVTIWFERGQSYVTKALRDAVAAHHETFIFARTGLVDGQMKMETGGMWDVENLTTHPTYEIPPAVLGEWIRSNRLDTVVFNEEYDWLLVEFAKSTGVRIVTYLDYLKRDWLPKLRLFDLVICSTRRSYEIVRNVCNAVYIGWGVDTELFAPRTDDAPAHTFFHNAGWLGTNFRKMTPAAILAFNAIAPLVPEATLFIHAQSARERLPHPVQAILDSNRRITTHIGSVPAPGLYHKGRILLFPTKLEGLGLPLLEAMSSGLAVVAADAPPMNEFVRNGENGLLVPVAGQGSRADGILFPELIIDVNALAEAMLRLARNPGLVAELGANAREYALRHLGTQAFRQRIHAMEIFAPAAPAI